jgi:hypothetical protein
MKVEYRDPIALAPREERAILDEIRNDRELIARLKITPRELDALSKCALFGTMTCKQDMLFILRQIREAGLTSIDQVPLVAQPAGHAEKEQEPAAPAGRQNPARAMPTVIPEPASLESIVRRRVPEQFGVLFWVVVLVAGLVWNGIIVISRWRDNFLVGTLGTPVSQAPAADAWYNHFDRPNVLLWWEILFVGVVALVMYLKSRNATRHLKVKPGRYSR